MMYMCVNKLTPVTPLHLSVVCLPRHKRANELRVENPMSHNDDVRLASRLALCSAEVGLDVLCDTASQPSSFSFMHEARHRYHVHFIGTGSDILQ